VVEVEPNRNEPARLPWDYDGLEEHALLSKL
jgi:hypothetical protein